MNSALPSLLFLPGLLCDETLWAHQVKNLADISQPQVMNLMRDNNVAGMAQRVLQEAPDKFALTGLSMGGYVALEIMRQAPERVIKLALCDTSARPDSPETMERRHGLITLAQTGKFKGVTPRLLPLLVHPDRVNDETVSEPVMQMAERMGRDVFVAQQQAIIGRTDSRPHLKDIKVQTLVMCGRQDQITPLPVAEELASGIAGAKLAIIEDSGHLPPLEQPTAATALLRQWLLY